MDVSYMVIRSENVEEVQMNSRDRERHFLGAMNVAPKNDQLFQSKRVSAVILSLILIVNALPAAAASTPFHPNNKPNLQAGTTLTFTANADAHVEQLHPTVNNGTSRAPSPRPATTITTRRARRSRRDCGRSSLAQEAQRFTHLELHLPRARSATTRRMVS